MRIWGYALPTPMALPGDDPVVQTSKPPARLGAVLLRWAAGLGRHGGGPRLEPRRVGGAGRAAGDGWGGTGHLVEPRFGAPFWGAVLGDGNDVESGKISENSGEMMGTWWENVGKWWGHDGVKCKVLKSCAMGNDEKHVDPEKWWKFSRKAGAKQSTKSIGEMQQTCWKDVMWVSHKAMCFTEIGWTLQKIFCQKTVLVCSSTFLCGFHYRSIRPSCQGSLAPLYWNHLSDGLKAPCFYHSTTLQPPLNILNHH